MSAASVPRRKGFQQRTAAGQRSRRSAVPDRRYGDHRVGSLLKSGVQVCGGFQLRRSTSLSSIQRTASVGIRLVSRLALGVDLDERAAVDALLPRPTSLGAAAVVDHAGAVLRRAPVVPATQCPIVDAAALQRRRFGVAVGDGDGVQAAGIGVKVARPQRPLGAAAQRRPIAPTGPALPVTSTSSTCPCGKRWTFSGSRMATGHASGGSAGPAGPINLDAARGEPGKLFHQEQRPPRPRFRPHGRCRPREPQNRRPRPGQPQTPAGPRRTGRRETDRAGGPARRQPPSTAAPSGSHPSE